MYKLIDRAALKRNAKALMREGMVSPVKMAILYLTIDFVFSIALHAVSVALGGSVFENGLPLLFANIFITLVSLVLSTGYVSFCLGTWRRETLPYASLFDGFSFAGKIIALQVIMIFFIYLWSLLFIIPGIIAAYRYSFAMYNLCSNPELGIFEALNLSKQQTRGYKMQFFTLQLSFIGWALLISLPQSVAEAVYEFSASGINTGSILAFALMLVTLLGQFFLFPYMQLSFTGFYREATAPIEAAPEF